MVGIGGGIPSKVKLGDVVVSQPVADYHGVPKAPRVGVLRLRAAILRKSPAVYCRHDNKTIASQ
jgi:nucleoside phosphorylase